MLTRLIKLRLARLPRGHRTLSSQSPPEHLPPPLPPLSSLHLPETPMHAFPLYRTPPPPLPRHSESLPTSLDGLPSDRQLQVRQKQKLTRVVEAGVEEYTEEQLREFYAAVVQSAAEGEDGIKEGAVKKLEGPSRTERVAAPDIESGTKMGEEEVRTKILAGLSGRFSSTSEGVEGIKDVVPSGTDVRDIVASLVRFAEEDERISGTGSSSSGLRVPLGIISRVESRALLQETVKQGDASILIDLLETLPRLGVMVEREQIVELLDTVLPPSVSTKGRRALSQDEEEVVLVLSGIIQQQAQLQPAEQDLLVRTHLLSDPSGSSAIAHLRQSERLSLPAPQSSYNLALQHLTSIAPTSTTRAVAWDLFTHMRLVAHPYPSPEVYSTMISACAASSDPQPEMARDLWIQMTQEQRLEPAEREYTAYIRALCSTRGTYLEGFDVFRQMLARHHEVTYVPFGSQAETGEISSRFIPTNETWKALLEGTKRAGDLARARWVLQECVRLHGALGGQKGLGVDEDVMSSVFMTYAAWKPSVRRMAVREKGVNGGTLEGGESGQESGDRGEIPGARDESDISASTDIDSPPPDRGGMFASRVPVTSADALHEASILFDALIPSSSYTNPHSQPTPHTIFSDVNLTTRLVNSYLSITYAHAPSISDCRAQYDAISPYFSDIGRNGWTYLHALERCAIGQRTRASGLSAAEDRAASLSWAKTLWEEYIDLSQTLLHRLHSSPSTPRLAYSIGISPRQTERCWRAIIRVHALNDDLTSALDLLTKFHSLYPPEHITEAYTPNKEHGFSVRFSDPTLVHEADVPPHLLWKDVDVLHQRLVRDERWSEVGRVKWVCAAYEAVLRRRRRWRLDGVGKGREMRRSRRGAVGSVASGEREQIAGVFGEGEGEVLEEQV